MKIKHIIIGIVAFIFVFNVNAQQVEKKTPESFKRRMKSLNEVPIVSLPSFNVDSVLKEDSLLAEQKLKYLRFAKTIDVNINIKENGIVEKLPDGSRIWRIGIKSEDAYSLNFYFDEFSMVSNATLFVYSKDKKHVVGEFSKKDKKNQIKFHTPPVKGDVVYLEIFEPKKSDFESDLIISKVNHDYRNVFKYLKDAHFGASGACNVDINCNVGNDWQNEKESVCRMIIYGSGLCSGALINNKNNDGKFYFLTADHCYTTHYASDYTGAVSNTDFYFNYESPSCNGGDGLTTQVVSGATLIANWSVSDFCLLELNSILSVVNNPYYSGWSVATSASNGGVGIHHPQGDVKKISIETDPLVQAAYPNETTIDHWRVHNWDVGVTEGGSSGSPLYNQEHKIIGQLHGGYAACNGSSDNGLSDWYGGLFSSWNGGGADASRLKVWLDPTNTVNEWSGLRYIKNTTINSNTNASGDMVKFENVNVQNNSNIEINIDETFKATGTLSIPQGAIIKITP